MPFIKRLLFNVVVKHDYLLRRSNINYMWVLRCQKGKVVKKREQNDTHVFVHAYIKRLTFSQLLLHLTQTNTHTRSRLQMLKQAHVTRTHTHMLTPL
jgi:hypothetical protein